MSSERFIAGGLFALGLAALGGFALSQTATAQDATDGPGPNLVIEVAGSTTGTITIDPARLMGVADRVGSLEVGKDADLVLFSHHPFDVQALALRTWIDGRLVYDRAAAEELAHVRP